MISHLLLMRHAEAEWGKNAQADHERRLSQTGQREADTAANTLTARGFAPDLIWASDAVRTQETARRLIGIIPGAQTILKIPEFYHASAAQVLAKCEGAPEPDGRLMLLGHNPGWSDLAAHFIGYAPAFPTAACFVFIRQRQNGDWLSPSTWRLIDQIKVQEPLP